MQRTLHIRLKNIEVSLQNSHVLVDKRVGPCQKKHSLATYESIFESKERNP